MADRPVTGVGPPVPDAMASLWKVAERATGITLDIKPPA